MVGLNIIFFGFTISFHYAVSFVLIKSWLVLYTIKWSIITEKLKLISLISPNTNLKTKSIRQFDYFKKKNVEQYFFENMVVNV